MTEAELDEGSLVVHSGKPEWGPGKVVHARGDLLYVFFRDHLQRRAMKFKRETLSAAGEQTDSVLDGLPPFVDRDGDLLLPSEPLAFGAACDKFTRRYPGGFEDAGYIGGTKTGERIYKWQAHERLSELLGDGRGRARLADVGALKLSGMMVKALGEAKNLLAAQELIAFREGLEDDGAAHRYFESLFDLLDAGPAEEAFTAHAAAVAALPARGATHTDKWTIATVCPYLVRPDAFIYMKPEVTKKAAATLAFDVRYAANPNWLTYERALRMATAYLEKLRPLGARDFIDVQSFFWVVGGPG